MDQTGKWNSLLLFSGSKSKGITDGGWFEMPLLEAIPEERF
jgi:hypothetical protein